MCEASIGRGKSLVAAIYFPKWLCAYPEQIVEEIAVCFKRFYTALRL